MRKNPAVQHGLIEDWRPEDETFWKTTGRRIARRNLWISVPALVVVSIESTGTPRLALFGFIAFYVTCLFVTWWWYRRRGAEVRCD